jgi:hypothetical protein
MSTHECPARGRFARVFKTFNISNISRNGQCKHILTLFIASQCLYRCLTKERLSKRIDFTNLLHQRKVNISELLKKQPKVGLKAAYTFIYNVFQPQVIRCSPMDNVCGFKPKVATVSAHEFMNVAAQFTL